MNSVSPSHPRFFRAVGASLVALSLAAMMPAQSADATPPSAEQLWRIIQEQQAQITALTARVEAFENSSGATAQRIEAVDAKVEATSSYIENLAADGAAGGASAADAWYQRTQFGGYGEMHLNWGDSKMIDFHRWVLFVSHEFSDRIRMVSEFELEHSIAGDGQKGEIELEQAYLEFDLNESTRAKAGVFLIPVGILNETHEPNTFYGVERNRVESEIIPSTWWEGGAALTKQFSNGTAFDLALHSGLSVPTSGSNAFRIRSGRRKVSEASASDPAVTTRLKYTGIAGLELAVSAQYQTDLAQGALAERIDATFLTAHADWRRGGFGLRALYGRWDIDGAAPEAIGADVKTGYYLEPSYRFSTEAGDVGFFARYSRYDNNAGDAARSANSYYDFGVNYWPHQRVVLKADLQITDLANPTNDDEIINLGVGYQF